MALADMADSLGDLSESMRTIENEQQRTGPVAHIASILSERKAFANGLKTNDVNESSYSGLTDKSTSAEAGRPSEGIPGLKYNKSVYQKLWGGKDALIAVMG